MVRGALVLELGQAKDSQPYTKQGPALTEPFPLPKVDGAIISALLPLSCLTTPYLQLTDFTCPSTNAYQSSILGESVWNLV